MGHGIQDPAESEDFADRNQHCFSNVRLGSPSNQSNGPEYGSRRIGTGSVCSRDFGSLIGDVTRTSLEVSCSLESKRSGEEPSTGRTNGLVTATRANGFFGANT